MSDGHMPHRFPPRYTWPNDDPECLAWKCAACGVWVNEFHPERAGDCPIDWRYAAGASEPVTTRTGISESPIEEPT